VLAAPLPSPPIDCDVGVASNTANSGSKQRKQGSSDRGWDWRWNRVARAGRCEVGRATCGRTRLTDWEGAAIAYGIAGVIVVIGWLARHDTLGFLTAPLVHFGP
jgi:hypothetical protein